MLVRRALPAIPAAVVASTLTFSVGEAAGQSSVTACTSRAEDGQRLRAAGKLLEAREKLMACTATECPQVVRTDCAQWAAEVLATTPTIVIDVKDAAGNDVADATVFVDDRRVADRIDGRPVAVDPGSHVVRVERTSGASAAQSIVAKENEKARAVRLVIDGATSDSVTTNTSGGSWGPLHYAGIAMIAVGAIAITYGMVTYLTYVSDESDLKTKFDVASREASGCSSGSSPASSSCAQAIEQREQLRAAYNENEADMSAGTPLMLTALVGGVLLIGGGVTMFVLAPRRPAPTTKASPVVTPAFAGFVLGGSF